MALSEAHDEANRVFATEAETPDEGTPPSSEERAPSPFLPGTNIQFAWDSTSLGYLKTCPRKYYYKLIEGWSNETGIHLRWGSEFHSALEDYERSKACGILHDDSMHDTLRALLTRLDGWEPEPRSKSEEYKTKEKLLEAVVWYLDKYENDPAVTVVLGNGKPAVELSFQFELDFGPYSKRIAALRREDTREWARADQIEQEIKELEKTKYLLCGHLDRVVTFADELYVMDHKTTTSTPGSYYFDGFSPNNQMSLYTLASQVILKAPIKGVIIDVVQVAVGFTGFSRGITLRTGDQLEEWLDDTKHWLRYAERLTLDGNWPMNDTSCGNYGGCEFRGVCSKSPSVRERFLEAGFERREPWNPLKPR